MTGYFQQVAAGIQQQNAKTEEDFAALSRQLLEPHWQMNFQQITCCIHLSYNSKMPKKISQNFGRCYKLSSLINILNTSFQKAYSSYFHVAVDKPICFMANHNEAIHADQTKNRAQIQRDVESRWLRDWLSLTLTSTNNSQCSNPPSCGSIAHCAFFYRARCRCRFKSLVHLFFCTDKAASLFLRRHFLWNIQI